VHDPGGEDLLDIEGTTTQDDDYDGNSCNSSNRLLSSRSPQVLAGIANLTISNDSALSGSTPVMATTAAAA